MQAQRRAEQAFARVVARSWQDDSFRRALMKNPTAVLRSAGVDVPAGVRLHVHQESERELHLVLPSPPTGGVGEAIQIAARALPQWCTVGLFRGDMARLERGDAPRMRNKKKIAHMTRLLPKWRTVAGRAAIIADYKKRKAEGRLGIWAR